MEYPSLKRSVFILGAFCISRIDNSITKGVASNVDERTGNYGCYLPVMYIRRFQYKPDDVDCRLCTEFRKRKCTLEGCPWIAERIEAGVVSYAEAVMKVFSSYGLLRHRLADLVDSYPGTFWIDERHRNRIEWFNHQLGYNPRRNTPAYYAALYLLTSSEELHRGTSNCFYRKGLACPAGVSGSLCPLEQRGADRKIQQQPACQRD